MPASSGTTNTAETALAPPAALPARLTRRLRLILAVVLVADAIDLIDSTITNIAAPSIVGDLGGGQALVKWFGASYALTMGVLLVVGGRLGDRFGRRRTFLVGMAGFGVSSLACGLAVDPAALVVSRLVQGGFGALLIPQGIGLLLATFSREQFSRAVVAFGPVLAGSAVLGPIVGGFIVSTDIAGLGWRPVFLLNVVLCAIGLVAAWHLLPPDTDLDHTPIDVRGALCLGVSMLGLIFGLIDGSTDGWDLRALLALLVGVVALGLFAQRQRTAPQPLLARGLLGNRGFTSGLLMGLAYFAVVNGFAYVVSLYLQLHLHLTPDRAAIGLAPMMVGIMAAAFVARPLIGKYGRALVVAGLLLTLGGTLLLLGTAASVATLTAPEMIPALLVLGAGMGTCFSSIYDVAVGDVAPDHVGGASGSLSAVQQLASAIGSATITSVYFNSQNAGAVPALERCLLLIAVVTGPCLGLVRLLPAKAAAEPAH